MQVGNLGRLQCVKAAVISQLKQLRDEHPTRKVALVTFDSEVIFLLTVVSKAPFTPVDCGAVQTCKDKGHSHCGNSPQYSTHVHTLASMSAAPQQCTVRHISTRSVNEFLPESCGVMRSVMESSVKILQKSTYAQFLRAENWGHAWICM